MSNYIEPDMLDTLELPENSFQDQKTALLSIVLPAYNEERNIARVYHKLKEILATIPIKHEIIFVDDGSMDQTSKEVEKLCEQDDQVILIKLTRNFGHQSALLAGMSNSQGDAIITLDCDLQHPPQMIEQMVDLWERGTFIVQMRRKNDTDTRAVKSLLSRSFYRLINSISNVHLVENAADFQLLDRQAVSHILQVAGQEPFIRGLISWLGFPTIVLDYQAESRYAEQPAYTFKKNLHMAWHAVLQLSSKPLNIGLFAGIILFFLSIAYIIYAIINHYQGETLPGWTSLVTLVLVVGSMQMLMTGVMGNYIRLIYESSRKMPTFVHFQPYRKIQKKNAVPQQTSDATSLEKQGKT
ncbi:glycosyltransferase family 2 protein [Magnetococcus sp. PR-3]|uniref:glycosyltransferase family 2 protein n=1 Tax=Magnetococcus sp. PR-3 TaxID=3120355 RepID=UPI002FCDEB95